MTIDNKKLPDFMIVGAPKSGTTSLYHYLKKHKSIFFPDRKEPWFFSSKDGLRPGIVKTLEEYSSLFEEAENYQIIGEASVSYLCAYDVTIKNIQKVYNDKAKDIKIIMILRNPMDRAYSRYKMFERDGFKQDSFIASIEKEYKLKNPKNYWDDNSVDCSFYARRIKAFQDNFKNVLCIKYDDFKKDSDNVVKKVFDFLELENIDVDTSIRFNNSGNPKNRLIHNLINGDNILKRVIKAIMPFDLRVRIKEKINNKNLKTSKISKDDYEYLYHKYFKEEIESLEKSLGWDLENWKDYEKYYKK